MSNNVPALFIRACTSGIVASILCQEDNISHMREITRNMREQLYQEDQEAN